jgi:hypothetical protein
MSYPTKQELIDFYKKNNRGEEHEWKFCELTISLNKNLTIIQLKDNKRYKYGLDICYTQYISYIYGKEKQLTLEYLRNEISDNEDFGMTPLDYAKLYPDRYDKNCNRWGSNRSNINRKDMIITT